MKCLHKPLMIDCERLDLVLQALEQYKFESLEILSEIEVDLIDTMLEELWSGVYVTND